MATVSVSASASHKRFNTECARWDRRPSLSLWCHFSCILTPKNCYVGAWSHSVTNFNPWIFNTRLSELHCAVNAGYRRALASTVTLPEKFYILEPTSPDKVRKHIKRGLHTLQMFSCQLPSPARKRRKLSRKLETGIEDLVLTRAAVASSQSYQEAGASHAPSVLPITGECSQRLGLPLSVTIRLCNSTFLNTSNSERQLYEGSDACWTLSSTSS